MAKTVQLRISDIKLLLSLKIREINQDHVKTLMENIDDTDPIVVYDITDRDFTQPCLVAGSHRRIARLNLGQDHIWAERKEGLFCQALEEAITSNTKHLCLPLTITERRAAGKLLLKQFPERANNYIASCVGLSDKTVKVLRTQLESDQTIPHVDSFIGKDDKERKARDSSNTSGELNLHLSFNMGSEEQLKIVSDGLVQAGIDGETKKANRALELMAAEYLSSHPRTFSDTGGAEQGTIKMTNHDEM